MLERRKEKRRRTLLDGEIIIEKLNGWSLDCTVRNVSGRGARVALPSDIVVPERFDLSISGALGRPARLVWYREGFAGVELIDQRDSQSPASNESCRRTPTRKPHETVSSSDMLAARIAAIATRGSAASLERR